MLWEEYSLPSHLPPRLTKPNDLRERPITILHTRQYPLSITIKFTANAQVLACITARTQFALVPLNFLHLEDQVIIENKYHSMTDVCFES